MNTILKQLIERTILVEKSAIERLISQDFDPVVNAILGIHESSGALIVCGEGKSAIVAQKFVATLNSTGTSASFLHGGDALHGDMGVINKGDIVVLISKSGDSNVLRTLVPTVKKMGAAIIGLSSRLNSFLLENSDYDIYIPCLEEADPNNLAPTASVVAHLAICDAMALGLQHLSGFTPYNFASLHPAGSLGKNLNLTAGEMAKKHDAPHVLHNADLPSIIFEITNKRLGATCVLDANNKIVGIITDGDLRRYFGQIKTGDITASGLMNSNPKKIDHSALATDAMRKMKAHSISQLIVVDENKKYTGMIHLHDLIKEGIVS